MSDSIAPMHVAHLLPAFVVDTLALDERQNVLAHVAICATCRAELATWHKIDDALHEPAPPLPAADAVLREVWRRVDAGSCKEQHGQFPVAHLGQNGRPHGYRASSVVPLPLSIPPTVPPPALLAPPGSMRRQWAPARVAILLLLVLLSAGVFTSGSGRSFLAQHLPQASLVTIQAPGLAGAESEERLVTVTLPAAMVPVGNAVRSCLSHIVIPPDVRASWDAKDAGCCPGTRLNYVLKGTYAVWPEGPVRVIRADQTTETAQAGSELHLSAGDTIVLGSDTPYAADNPGDMPTELLQYILASPPDFPRGTATLAGWHELDYDMPDIPLQGGPATMTLVRFVLAPDAVLSGPPGTALMQVTMPPDDGEDAPPSQSIVSSRISPGLQSDITNHGRMPVAVYVLALEPSGVNLMP